MQSGKPLEPVVRLRVLSLLLIARLESTVDSAVEFSSTEAVDVAVDKVAGTKIAGREVRIDYARPDSK